MSGTEKNIVAGNSKKDVPTIPNQCIVTSPSKHQTLIVCTPKSEESSAQIATMSMSSLFSVIALIISISSFFYTFYKDKKSRRRSIEDDFWIRKVLSPPSIEKLLEFTTSTTSELMHQSLNGTLSKQIDNTFGRDSLSEIRIIARGFSGLSLISKELSLKVADELELYEDCLANFYGKVLRNNTNKITSPPPCVSEITENLNEIQHRIFNLIKDYQLNS